MKKTILSYLLVAAVIYTLNIAAAFIVTIGCGREGYDNKIAWLIFFILLLILSLYLVRAGSTRRLLGQMLITISTTGFFSTLIYDPFCFRINYFGRSVSAIVCIFAEALLAIGLIHFLMFLMLILVYATTNSITEAITTVGTASLGYVLGSALVCLLPYSNSSPSEILSMLIPWVLFFASISLVAAMTQKRSTAQQCEHATQYAEQHGYALFIITFFTCALIVSL